MKPVDYSERIPYRPPPALYSRMQRLGVALTSRGFAPQGAVTLETRGRKSGKLRRTPVILLDHEGGRYIVALAGESNWVRNVRAVDGQAVLRRRGSLSVRLVELPVADRATVIDAYLRRHGRRDTKAGANEATHYFGLSPQPSLAEIAAIARYYPVFRVET